MDSLARSHRRRKVLTYGAYGASLGALTGPAAPIAAPVLGLVFGAVGYYAGSTAARGTIWGGKALIDWAF